jgi:molybdopterin molybdotransferase
MAAPLPVETALARIVGSAAVITQNEDVSLSSATGRVLAAPLAAHFTQPPFDASAMDGYDVRTADVRALPAQLRVIGESAAGHSFSGALGAGDAVRIFTGAPIPTGADAIVIQEDTTRDGGIITVTKGVPDADHIRPAGGDFSAGQTLIGTDRRLTARHITLAAAMGHPTLRVRRRPVVAILATGDELVLPGTTPGPDQIVCSNIYGIAAMVAAAGGEPRLIGIARDTPESLTVHVEKAQGADVLITVGGASVGDHDLVSPVLQSRGMALNFWNIAMRPGKPLMHGRLGGQHVLGLPGNPVSSLVCTRLFLIPLIRALLGLPAESDQTVLARTVVALAANGIRAHYMRATLEAGPDNTPTATPVRSQDSSLLTPLAGANCLLVRPVGAPALPAGSLVPTLALDF